MFPRFELNSSSKSGALKPEGSSQSRIQSTLAEQLKVLEHALEINLSLAEQMQQISVTSRDMEAGVDNSSNSVLEKPSSPVSAHAYRECTPRTGRKSTEVGCFPNFQLSQSRTPRVPDSARSDASLYRPLLAKGGNLQSVSLQDHFDCHDLGHRGPTTRLASLFPRVDDLVETLQESLRDYDVEDEYHETGCFQAFARNSVFKSFTLFVIVVSVLWIAIETDYNHATVLSQAPLVFQVADNFFCGYFCFEVMIRFMAFERTGAAGCNGWFLFDLAIALMMMWETWALQLLFHYGYASAQGDQQNVAHGAQGLRVLRLVRLVRVARATRLLKAAPELLILVKGIVAGLRSVIAVLLLLMLLIYVFAIMFTLNLANTEFGAGVFERVPQSMNTLLLQVLCGPDEEFMKALAAAHRVSYVWFLIFILFANLTMMNMLIGILCDVVSNVAREAKEEEFKKEVQYQISRLVKDLDSDASGSISHDELFFMLKDPVTAMSFNSLGVDIVGVADFARFVFAQCDEITYSDFELLIGQFRGDKPAAVKDIMEVRRYVTMELLSLESRVSQRIKKALKA